MMLMDRDRFKFQDLMGNFGQLVFYHGKVAIKLTKREVENRCDKDEVSEMCQFLYSVLNMTPFDTYVIIFLIPLGKLT